MSFTIKRTTEVVTTINLESLDIDKLKKDLEDHGYLEEIDDFKSEAELISILKEDSYVRSLVFYVLMNSSGYGVPQETFLDGEVYEIE